MSQDRQITPAFVESIRRLLKRFRFRPPKNHWYRMILALLAKVQCVSTCTNGATTITTTVGDQLVLIRDHQQMAKETLVLNNGPRTISVFEDGHLVALIEPSRQAYKLPQKGKGRLTAIAHPPEDDALDKIGEIQKDGPNTGSVKHDKLSGYPILEPGDKFYVGIPGDVFEVLDLAEVTLTTEDDNFYYYNVVLDGSWPNDFDERFIFVDPTQISDVKVITTLRCNCGHDPYIYAVEPIGGDLL